MCRPDSPGGVFCAGVLTMRKIQMAMALATVRGFRSATSTEAGTVANKARLMDEWVDGNLGSDRVDNLDDESLRLPISSGREQEVLSR